MGRRIEYNPILRFNLLDQLTVINLLSSWQTDAEVDRAGVGVNR